MKALTALPQNYQQYLSVDLQKDKKLAIFINLLAMIIGVLMAVPMNFVVSISTLFDMSVGLGNYFLRLVVLLFGMVGYIILHEAVHAAAMKLSGTKKVKFGLTGLYAFAGSNDFYCKSAYIFIALAPIVLLGVVLLILNFLVPASWFWVIYFIQIINISGAAGDLYVTMRFIKLPKDILIQDAGTSMTVYLNK